MTELYIHQDDIIKIYSSTNEELNNKIVLVSKINENSIEVIAKNYKTTLFFNEELGGLIDVDEIELLSRKEIKEKEETKPNEEEKEEEKKETEEYDSNVEFNIVKIRKNKVYGIINVEVPKR